MLEPKLGGLGNFFLCQKFQQKFEEENAVAQKLHGWSCRVRSLPRKPHTCRKGVGLPLGSSTQPRILGSRHLPHATQSPFAFAFPTLRVQSELGAGEDESTATSRELSEAFHMLYSPSSDFHPSKFGGMWQEAKNYNKMELFWREKFFSSPFVKLSASRSKGKKNHPAIHQKGEKL